MGSRYSYEKILFLESKVEKLQNLRSSPSKLCTRSKRVPRRVEIVAFSGELQRQEGIRISYHFRGRHTSTSVCERIQGPIPPVQLFIMGKHKDRCQEVMPSDMRYTAGGTTSKFDMNTYVPPSPTSSSSSASRILTALDPISPLFAPKSPPSSKTPPAFTLKD